MLAARVPVLPYEVFDVRVTAVQRLSPSFVRITFGGDDLAAFADNGHDQRIKLVLPLARGHEHDPFRHFPTSDDWYGRWRALPEDRRNPIRTYTVRRLHRAGTRAARLDVDMVLHGDSGPATRWAARARIGDRLLVIGPNRLFHGDTGGVEFRPGPSVRQVLIGADASAVPAAAAIVEHLPPATSGLVLLEVPDPGDRYEFPRPPGVTVRWLVATGHEEHGAALVAATVRAAAGLSGRPVDATVRGPEPEPVGPDLLWEVPDPGQMAGSPLYIWLAGEAGTVTTIRRRLVRELDIDRRTVAFLGYWRKGRAEG